MHFAGALVLLLSLMISANARYERRFKVSCRKKIVGNQLKIKCDADGQTITKVTYSLNSGSPIETKLPITIPVSDLGDRNTIDLVITGNGGSQRTISLEATKPTIAPKCKISRSETVITISCKKGSVEIGFYKYYINGEEIGSEEIGSGRGISIEIDATNTAFKNGTNRVLVVLLAADGSTEVDRKTFIVEITSQMDLHFINDTPVLVGGTISSQFTADRDGLVYQCHLTHFDDTGFRDDCSSGEYNRTGMPPGDYTLRVIATDPISGERQVIRSRLWVHSDDANDPFCILYLRNRGWRVVKDIFIVDFAGTGAASRPDAAFECSLDRATHVPCTSPYVLTGLSPGVHHVRVRPTTCGRDYHVWNKRFTIE